MKKREALCEIGVLLVVFYPMEALVVSEIDVTLRIGLFVLGIVAGPLLIWYNWNRG